MSEKYNLESLLEESPNLSNDELKWDYLNKVEFTQPLGNLIESLEDFDLALRIVKLAFDIDLKLGAYLAGKVKEEWQEETVNLIDELKVPPVLKIVLLLKTQSEAAIPRLAKFLQHEDSNVVNTAITSLLKIEIRSSYSRINFSSQR